MGHTMHGDGRRANWQCDDRVRAILEQETCGDSLAHLCRFAKARGSRCLRFPTAPRSSRRRAA